MEGAGIGRRLIPDRVAARSHLVNKKPSVIISGAHV